MATEIVMYGSDWCGFTVRAKRQLDEWGVAYRYVDVDQTPDGEELLSKWSNGPAIRPALDLGDEVLVNPAAEVLRAKLTERGLLAADR